MPKAEHADVDAYIAAAAAERQPTLQRLRRLIRETVPNARESIQYGMPAYELKDLFCAFAAQKHHFSFYLMNENVLEAHRDRLGKLNCGKGCIRFRKDADLPDELVESLVKLAAAENLAGRKTDC